MSETVTTSSSPAHAERALAPTEERIIALDVVRGFAAFGILMVNIQTFGGPYPLYVGEPWTDPLSQAVYAFVDFAFVSKFFPLFSMLFGIGLLMQLDRADASGESAIRFARRRLTALFLIGLVHVTLLSTIDILVQYAAFGFLLFALRRAAPRVLLGVAATALAVPVVFATLAAAYDLEGSIYPGEVGARDYIAAYGHGTLRDVWAMRAHEIRDYYAWVLVFAGWKMFATILVGAWAVRTGLIAELETRRDELVRVCRGAFAIGVPAAATHALIWISSRGEDDAVAVTVVSSLASALGEPALAVGYATALALLVRRPSLATSLAPVANLGRLALTSYVFQSLFMSFWFFSYGLGYYGLYGPVACIAFVVSVYVGELVLAALWSRWFRFGPLEAVWRAMTYGRWPAMRRPSVPITPSATMR